MYLRTYIKTITDYILYKATVTVTVEICHKLNPLSVTYYVRM